MWIVFVGVMGFFAGGSFESAFFAPEATAQSSTATGQNTDKTQALEERHQATEEAIAYYNKWLMVFTAVLALATILLGSATVALYRSAEKQIDIARISAQAADESAKAAVATERARMYVNIDANNFADCINTAAAWENTPSIDENPIAASNLPMAKIKFRNYGKTPAIVIEVGLVIFLAGNDPMPVWDVKVVRENIIAPSLTTEEFTEIITGTQMTFKQAKDIRDGRLTLWVAGYCSYDDVFGQRRTHRFLQRFVPVIPRIRYVLQAYDYEHYNKSD
jgi:hypothetical protein